MSYFLTLPQLQAELKHTQAKNEILLVAGGKAPDPDWLAAIAQKREVWCADSGIDSCFQNNIKVHHLVGDGDSATKNGWNWAIEQGIPIERFSTKKDLTDTQLALKKISEIHPEAFVILSGVWGGRFDHAFSNIFSLAGAKDFGVNACAADEKEVMFILNGPEELHLEFHDSPHAISLLPLSKSCQPVSIRGVYWELDHVCLEQHMPYAISNELVDGNHKIQVSVESGCLGVYLQWE
jgi:thiamine pyrophosphokinase